MNYYRKEYGVEIIDDNIKKQYSNYINNALNSTNENTSNQ